MFVARKFFHSYGFGWKGSSVKTALSFLFSYEKGWRID